MKYILLMQAPRDFLGCFFIAYKAQKTYLLTPVNGSLFILEKK